MPTGWKGLTRRHSPVCLTGQAPSLPHAHCVLQGRKPGGQLKDRLEKGSALPERAEELGFLQRLAQVVQHDQGLKGGMQGQRQGSHHCTAVLAQCAAAGMAVGWSGVERTR